MSNIETEKIIIEAAKKKFTELGIARVTMNDIAEEAGLTRRTIYRYFASKEEMAYQVMLSYMKIWNDQQQNLAKDLKGNGIQKLEALFIRLLEYMLENIHIMKFLSNFDDYFKDESNFVLDETIKKKANQSFHLSDHLFEEIIEEGIKDGSIKPLEDKERVLPTMINVLWNFGMAIAVRGKHIGEDAGLDAVEMFRCQVELYMEALKGDKA
jgi:AcrR family transcriptional regulator